MTGDVSQTYGLANVDALSVKRQRTLSRDQFPSLAPIVALGGDHEGL
jgi:hypothetical protein